MAWLEGRITGEVTEEASEISRKQVVQGLVGHEKALKLGYEGGKKLFEDHVDQNCLLE